MMSFGSTSLTTDVSRGVPSGDLVRSQVASSFFARSSAMTFWPFGVVCTTHLSTEPEPCTTAIERSARAPDPSAGDGDGDPTEDGAGSFGADGCGSLCSVEHAPTNA